MTELLIKIIIFFIGASAIEDFPFHLEYDTTNVGRELQEFVNDYCIVRVSNGSVGYHQSKLVLCCDNYNTVGDIFQVLSEITTPKEIWIHNCKLPLKPLPELFEELNINGSQVDFLALSFEDLTEPLEEGNYTNGLNIKTLLLKTFRMSFDFMKLNPDFMMPLKSLTTFIVQGVHLPLLPEQMRLKTLVINPRTIIPSWDRYCRDLDVLSIFSVDDIPTTWPLDCSQLRALRVRFLFKEARDILLSSGLNASCANLQYLSIEHTLLNGPPVELLSKGLQRINFTDTSLRDKDISKFPRLFNLTHLDLSVNRLRENCVSDIAQRMPALKYLTLDRNQNVDFCTFGNDVEMSFGALTSSLVNLSVRSTPTDPGCFRDTHFSKLEYFNLGSYSGKVFNLLLTMFPSTNASRLTVDLRNQEVLRVAYNEHDDDFQNLPLTVFLDPINCDCHSYGLARYLRNSGNDSELAFPGLRCKNSGAKITDEPLKNINCIKFDRDGCVIRYFTDRTVKVDCHHSNLKALPDLSSLIGNSLSIHLMIFEKKSSEPLDLTEINMTDNQIETINTLKMYDTPKRIDLRRNRLKYLDPSDTRWLFSARRRVWIAHNLLVCECETSSMIDDLHRHRDQIADYDELICYNNGKPLHSVSTFEVCQYGRRISLGAGLTLTVCVLCAAFLVWHFKLQVKIYLYSRGWCLSCLHEEDVDSDRPYDVFLSFCHEDEQYVVNELLPKLESEPHCYRVCVHYRDWVPGEWIPAQIMRSVATSKRTIVVLSQHFVKSMWSTLEFRYALASSSKEGRVRLIVVVVDEVLSEELEPELQSYLAFNTYLHRGADPWFWEKLVYSLPRRHPPTPLRHPPTPLRHPPTSLRHPPTPLRQQSAPNISPQDRLMMDVIIDNFSDMRIQ